MPKLIPFLKSEKGKPKDGPSVVGGFMLSWKWEDVFGKIAQLWRRKPKDSESTDSEVKGG